MAGRIAPKVSTDGLLMYLDATNTKSYIGSGTTWIDISGKGKNGLLTNSPTFSSSNLGSIVFDGLDDYVRFTNSEGRVLDGYDWFPMSTNAFTFDTWIKSPGISSGGTVNGIISLTYGVVMRVTTIGRVQLLVWDNVLSATTYTSSVKTNTYDGSWHHIVGTNDGLTSKIYIDGVLDTSTSAPFYGDVKTTWYVSSCVLGFDANDPPRGRFKGNMGVFRMYNRALSAQEVLQNYNTLKSRYSFTTINLDTDAQAFITAAGITDSTQQSAINTLVLSFKSYGIWTKMKAIYPMVGGTATTHKFNLKDPRDLDVAFRLVFINGWTHSSTGAKPDGTGWADTKIAPSTNLSQNSTHLSSYIRDTSTGVLIGVDVTYRLWIAPNFDGASKYIEINTQGTTSPSATISTAVGLWVGNRTASNSSKLFLNNTTNYTTTGVTSGLETSNIFISARNNGTSGINRSTAQCAFASVGDGLTDTEATNLYTAVQEYQTTLGRQV